MSAVRRALVLSSGANRGAYYAGFAGVLADHGVEFRTMWGVSAGAIAAAWFAARQAEDIITSWREACNWQVSPHPLFDGRRRRTVDELIRRITLRIMDVERARTSPIEVRLGAARIFGRRRLRTPRVELEMFSNREARDRQHFALMIRATGFVPLMNGLRAAVEIDGESYLDGGIVTRVPVHEVPVGEHDELWVAACSPHGRIELARRIAGWSRPERLVVVTPSEPLPVRRWTLDWPRVERTIEIGRRDLVAALRSAEATTGHVVVGSDAPRLRPLLPA